MEELNCIKKEIAQKCLKYKHNQLLNNQTYEFDPYFVHIHFCMVVFHAETLCH